jgi:hypothetical protein
MIYADETSNKEVSAMMRMMRNLTLVSLFILSASSVLHAAAQQNPAAGFPYRHSDFDYKIAWKTTQTNDVVVIDGILKNVRYPNIELVELTVFLQGPDGKVRARATALPFPQQSKMDEVATFSVKVNKVVLNPGDTLKFLIHYSGTEGGGGGFDWHSSFAADALTGASRHKGNIKPDEW